MRALQPVGEHDETVDDKILPLEVRKSLIVRGIDLFATRISRCLQDEQLLYRVQRQKTYE